MKITEELLQKAGDEVRARIVGDPDSLVKELSGVIRGDASFQRLLAITAAGGITSLPTNLLSTAVGYLLIGQILGRMEALEEMVQGKSS